MSFEKSWCHFFARLTGKYLRQHVFLQTGHCSSSCQSIIYSRCVCVCVSVARLWIRGNKEVQIKCWTLTGREAGKKKEAVDGPVGPLAAGYWSPAKPSGQCERGRSGRKESPSLPTDLRLKPFCKSGKDALIRTRLNAHLIGRHFNEEPSDSSTCEPGRGGEGSSDALAALPSFCFLSSCTPTFGPFPIWSERQDFWWWRPSPVMWPPLNTEVAEWLTPPRVKKVIGSSAPQPQTSQSDIFGAV